MAPAPRSDTVFAALGDRTRMRIVDRLVRDGPASAAALARRLPITRQAVSRHLAVLARAGVTVRERHGREIRHRLDPSALVPAAGWIADHAAKWDQAPDWLRRPRGRRRRRPD